MGGSFRPGRALAITIALVAAVFAASLSAAAAKPAVTITIAGMAYSTPQLTVRVGDTVEWINKDVVDHTSTEKKSALWNVSIAPGKSVRVVMTKAGTYDYFCRYHPNMTAQLIVAPGKRK